MAFELSIESDMETDSHDSKRLAIVEDQDSEVSLEEAHVHSFEECDMYVMELDLDFEDSESSSEWSGTIDSALSFEISLDMDAGSIREDVDSSIRLQDSIVDTDMDGDFMSDIGVESVRNVSDNVIKWSHHDVVVSKVSQDVDDLLSNHVERDVPSLVRDLSDGSVGHGAGDASRANDTKHKSIDKLCQSIRKTWKSLRRAIRLGLLERVESVLDAVKKLRVSKRRRKFQKEIKEHKHEVAPLAKSDNFKQCKDPQTVLDSKFVRGGKKL